MDEAPESCSSVATTAALMIEESPGVLEKDAALTSPLSDVCSVADPVVPFVNGSVSLAPQVILPALIDTTESTIPAIPKRGEQQQLLSFPNVSSEVQEDEATQIASSTNSSTISAATEVLRTPPRPLIEDKAAATGEFYSLSLFPMLT